MRHKILLVEGTCGTGKTTLLRGLLRKYACQEDKPRTILFITQAHTYFPIMSDDLPALPGKKEHRQHLRKIIKMLEWNLEGLQPSKWYALHGLIDTLHLTHAFRPGVLTWSELTYIDQYLGALGAKMIFLEAQHQTLWDRLIVGRGSDPAYLNHFQRRFGDTPEAVHAYYTKEQVQMRGLLRRSAMESLIVPAEDSSVDNLAQAYQFWLRD